jgi:deoxyribodipyrimidine photo-lyase
MRQLNTTGWMHNRMRMLAANFLAKDLFIEWRWGEEYFSRHLIDADLASNNGGWQWAASTGTDAAPYFRVFSPVCQSEKFDADGEFIRKFVPELRNVPARHIHEPWKHYSAAALNAMGYCMPMLDHEKAKLRVMEAFAALGKEDGNKGLKQWDMSGGGGSGKSDRGGRQRRGGGRALPN